MKYNLVLSTALLFASTALAQQPGTPPPGMPPMGGGMMHSPFEKKPAMAYADSVQFNAQFKELYPLIRPTPTVEERTQKMFGRMLPMFKSRGVDSAKAYDTIMKVLDKSKDEEILFDAYREAFTADEMKTMVGFFKTPAGKHYLEVEGKLTDARSRTIDQYVQRTMTSAVSPMEKPIERKPRPGMPGKPGMPGAPGVPPTPPTPPTPPSHD